MTQDQVWQAGPARVSHSPETLNWGPGKACLVRVMVDMPATDAAGKAKRPAVELELTDSGSFVQLNPGAARWLGNRLIEAALMAEQATGATPKEQTP